MCENLEGYTKAQHKWPVMLHVDSRQRSGCLSQKSLMKLPNFGEWWQGSIDIPSTVLQLDLVFSDSNKRAWDNNSNKDYHVAVNKSLSKEKLIEVGLCPHIWQDSGPIGEGLPSILPNVVAHL